MTPEQQKMFDCFQAAYDGDAVARPDFLLCGLEEYRKRQREAGVPVYPTEEEVATWVKEDDWSEERARLLAGLALDLFHDLRAVEDELEAQARAFARAGAASAQKALDESASGWEADRLYRDYIRQQTSQKPPESFQDKIRLLMCPRCMVVRDSRDPCRCPPHDEKYTHFAGVDNTVWVGKGRVPREDGLEQAIFPEIPKKSLTPGNPGC